MNFLPYLDSWSYSAWIESSRVAHLELRGNVPPAMPFLVSDAISQFYITLGRRHRRDSFSLSINFVEVNAHDCLTMPERTGLDLH